VTPSAGSHSLGLDIRRDAGREADEPSWRYRIQQDKERFMSKLLATLAAGALALSLQGFALAADDAQTGAQQPGAQEGQTGQQGDPAQRMQEYQAALKKCDAISGAPEKQKCIEAVKKRHGQM
jgi:hypothetical protein